MRPKRNCLLPTCRRPLMDRSGNRISMTGISSTSGWCTDTRAIWSRFRADGSGWRNISETLCAPSGSRTRLFILKSGAQGRADTELGVANNVEHIGMAAVAVASSTPRTCACSTNCVCPFNSRPPLMRLCWVPQSSKKVLSRQPTDDNGRAPKKRCSRGNHCQFEHSISGA